MDYKRYVVTGEGVESQAGPQSSVGTFHTVQIQLPFD